MSTFSCPRRDFIPGQDSWREDDTCSFCGSFNPDKLLSRLAAGDVELGPTDKRYKVYLRNRGGAPVPLKFYFQHFESEHRTRFIEMINAGTLHFGYPGYFYQTPYFIKYV